jgi:hypothetical protein
MKLFGFFALACLFAMGGGVSAQPTVYFQPDPAMISGSACGDALFCIDVRIDSIPNMAGYDVGITFRPDHLNFLDAREGDIFTAAGHSSFFLWTLDTGTSEDTVWVNAADLGGYVSGSGHLFSLCFVPPWNDEAVGSPLVFVKALVRDSANADVTVETTDGTISVYCPTSGDQVRWSTIKSLYR